MASVLLSRHAARRGTGPTVLPAPRATIGAVATETASHRVCHIPPQRPALGLCTVSSLATVTRRALGRPVGGMAAAAVAARQGMRGLAVATLPAVDRQLWAALPPAARIGALSLVADALSAAAAWRMAPPSPPAALLGIFSEAWVRAKDAPHARKRRKAEVDNDDANAVLAADIASLEKAMAERPFRMPFVSFRAMAYRAVELAFIFAPSVLLGILSLAFPTLRDTFAAWATSAAERAGVCFIKLAQWAGSRPDLFSEEAIHNFRRLQTGCGLHSRWFTEAVLRQRLGIGAPVDAFASIRVSPVASGSIAQIYRGRLRNGCEVAIKVRHPGVKVRVATDVALLRAALPALRLLPGAYWMNIEKGFDQFCEVLQVQLDLRLEALNLLRFQRNFCDSDAVIFPSPVVAQTTEAVLVETFEEGLPIFEFVEAVEDDDPDGALEVRSDIADIGLHMYLKMMLVDNFVHGDLHPGNILVRSARGVVNRMRNKHELVVLDAGLVGELNPLDRRNILALMEAIATKDGERAASLMLLRATDDECDDPDAFIDDMVAYIPTLVEVPLGELSLGVAFLGILDIVRRHQVMLETSFSTLVVATFLIEGVARRLDPGIDILKSALPYLMRSDILDEIDVGAVINATIREQLRQRRQRKVAERERERLENHGKRRWWQVWA